MQPKHSLLLQLSNLRRMHPLYLLLFHIMPPRHVLFTTKFVLFPLSFLQCNACSIQACVGKRSSLIRRLRQVREAATAYLLRVTPRVLHRRTNFLELCV
jgi:hypothetical protein